MGDKAAEATHFLQELVETSAERNLDSCAFTSWTQKLK